MEYVWAVLVLGLMLGTQFLHVFTLPANWLLLILALVWKLAVPDGGLDWTFIGVLAGMALLGEIIEFASQAWSAKKFGASAKGNLGGLIGAVLGAIFGAPLLLGLGALLGALLGAFAGCYLFEKAHGRGELESRRAAWGAFWGKMFGICVKIGLGGVMFFECTTRIWP